MDNSRIINILFIFQSITYLNYYILSTTTESTTGKPRNLHHSPAPHLKSAVHSAVLTAPTTTQSRPRGHCFSQVPHSSATRPKGTAIQASSSAMLNQNIKSKPGAHLNPGPGNNHINGPAPSKLDREQYYKVAGGPSRANNSPY